MMKKIGKMSFGCLLCMSLVIAPLMSKPAYVKAAESCTEHTNYYFFLNVSNLAGYESSMKGTASTHITSVANVIPANAEYVDSGEVKLSKDKTGVMSKSEWSMDNFWKYSAYANDGGNPDKVYTSGNVSYLGHGEWAKEGDAFSGDFKSLISDQDALTAASVITSNKIRVNFTTQKSPETLVDATIERTYPASADYESSPIIDGEAQDELAFPALYQITYKTCETSSDGGAGTPSGGSGSPSDKGSDGNVDKNVATADLPIYIIWAVGLGALGYSIYYFNKYYRKNDEM